MTGLDVRVRREEICNIAAQRGSIGVAELARRFGVSEVTLRTDLQALESEGRLTRVHGGAISSYKAYCDMSFKQRFSANERQKRAIAAAAARQIEDNDCVMLNAGTTTLFVLKALSGRKGLKIVTNSLAVALEANANTDFGVTLLGGCVNAEYQFSYGDDALRQLRGYRADKLILSVDGVQHEAGLSTYYDREAELCRLMLGLARVRIVAADFTKIGRTAMTLIAPPNSADLLITDGGAPSNELSALKRAGLRIITA